MRVRPITFTLPLLYRGAGLEVRATIERQNGRPFWPKEGSTKGVTVEVMEGSSPRTVFFGMFIHDHELFSSKVEVSNGQVRYGDRRLLPLLGDRSLFDVNVIPGFSRREASLF